jgi:hypothetical protein
MIMSFFMKLLFCDIAVRHRVLPALVVVAIDGNTTITSWSC